MSMQKRACAAVNVLRKEHMFQCWGRKIFMFDGAEWQRLSNAAMLPLAQEVLTRNGDFNNPKLPKLVAMTTAELRRQTPWAPLEWGRAYEASKKAQ